MIMMTNDGMMMCVLEVVLLTIKRTYSFPSAFCSSNKGQRLFKHRSKIRIHRILNIANEMVAYAGRSCCMSTEQTYHHCDP
jgi:hypothetical protein